MTDPLSFFQKTYGSIPDWVEKMNRFAPEILQHYTNLRVSVMADGALARKDKELILVGINAARRYEKSLLFHTKGAVDAGATLQELGEVLTVCILSRGLPAWLEGCKSLEYAAQYLNLQGNDLEVVQDPLVKHGFTEVQECLTYYRDALGKLPEWVDKLAAYQPDVLLHYSNLRVVNLREGQVSRKLKELVLVGINVAERYPEGVRIHIEGARAYGATDAELAECHLTAVLTAGIPAWFEGSIFLS